MEEKNGTAVSPKMKKKEATPVLPEGSTEATATAAKETKKKNRKSMLEPTSGDSTPTTPSKAEQEKAASSPLPVSPMSSVEDDEGGAGPEKKKKPKKRTTPVEGSSKEPEETAHSQHHHPRAITREKKAVSTNHLSKEAALAAPAADQPGVRRPVSMPPPATESVDKFSPRVSFQIKEVGKVKIGMYHNADKNRLEVIVTKFDELDKAEFGESPSTYVRLCLLPDEDTKFRSRIQRNTLYPTFDEKYSFYQDLENLKKKKLHLTFWKYDREKGNLLLGEVPVDLSTIYENARMDNWVPLMKPSRYLEDQYLSDDEPTIQRKPSIEVSSSKRRTRVFDLPNAANQKTIGEIKLTFDHDPDSNTLKIIVFGVKGLTGDKNMDLYVKGYIHPDPRKVTKKKTRVERNSLAPVFNETFVYHLEDFLKKIHLKAQTAEISLWQDGGLGKAAVQVGRVEIPLSDVFSSSYLSGWFPLFEDAKCV